MILYDSNKNGIEIAETPFAKGGEGAIYNVKHSLHKDCCVKIFHLGKISSRLTKLEYMINNQLLAPPNTQYKICWPLDFVYSGSERVGFLMPLAFKNSNSLYDIYLDDSNTVFDRRTEEGVVNRLKLLYNVANAINKLHEEGYVLVDFKPQNILITDTGQISMIDLDSIQIAKEEKLLFPATAFTAEYAFPAELSSINKKNIISQRWDCYSFAIVAYQILLGIHPFTASTHKKDKSGNEISGLFELMSNYMFPFGLRNRDISIIPPPQYYFYCLPLKIRESFVNTFNMKGVIPSMSDWLSTLLASIQSKDVVGNNFRKKPKPPIFIPLEKNVVKREDGDYLSLRWKSFYCDAVKVNGMDVTMLNETMIAVPSDRKIVISTHNKSSGTLFQTIFIPSESLYCINCGCSFMDNVDMYCTYCGTKKV